jgi:hypothetical protein
MGGGQGEGQRDHLSTILGGIYLEWIEGESNIESHTFLEWF